MEEQRQKESRLSNLAGGEGEITVKEATLLMASYVGSLSLLALGAIYSTHDAGSYSALVNVGIPTACDVSSALLLYAGVIRPPLIHLKPRLFSKKP